MTDPNVVYKEGFATLTRELGRVPTANECLGLHDAYKASYSEARDIRQAAERANARAAGPGDMSPSREPAPQARTLDSVARESAGEPLSGPRIKATGEQAESVPPPTSVNPEPSERPIAARRGPGGGRLATCRRCGSEFERPARKGRPPVECGQCRS